MEGLGWWIYLCSVAGGILVTALAISKILVYPGSDRPYKPVSFIYNTDPPYNSRVGLLEIRRAVRSLYTEE